MRAALDLDSNNDLAGPQDEIDLPASFAPIKYIDARSRGAVDQMGADRRFHQPAPGLPVLPGFIESKLRLRADERSVQYLKLGARRSLADPMRGELVQAGQHAGAGKQLQVVGQCRRIAGVLKLPDHFLIREYLAGMRAAELEKPPEQRGFVNPGQKQDVAGKGRLDEGVADVARPALPVGDKVRCSGIAAIIDEAVKVPPEGFPHLGVGPVDNGNGFEPAREAFGQPPLNEERRRTQENDLEGYFFTGVAVPKLFYHFGPAGHLLDLVQHKERPALARGLRCQ